MEMVLGHLQSAPTIWYLLVVDGVQEDLVAAGIIRRLSCTPVTDYWSYAIDNGQLVQVMLLIHMVHVVCVTSFLGTDSTATNYDPTATL